MLFPLKNQEAARSLKISWLGAELEHCPNPVYLRVALDHTLSYRKHIENTFSQSEHQKQHTEEALQLRVGYKPTNPPDDCFGSMLLHMACLGVIWHSNKLNPALNDSCRLTTGCLKPTDIEDLYLLAGIVPPDIRRGIVCHAERLKQTVDEKHPLHGQAAAPTRLKSRKSFMSHAQPLCLKRRRHG